jgi:DNA polymerase III epsilon subunit family exonuclease
MNELRVLSHQQPGSVSIENFQELKEKLTVVLSHYQNVVYTEAMLRDAKSDKTELARLRKDIDDQRKKIKKAYHAPYEEFEAKVKELIDLIDDPLEKIKEFVAEMEEREKQAKRTEIEAYFFQHSAVLDTMAQQVWDSPAFFEPKWLHKSTSVKTWKTAVDEKISAAARDLQTIQISAGQYSGLLMAKYMETLNTAGLAAYQEHLNAAMQTQPAQIVAAVQDHRIGSKVLKITGSLELLEQAVETLALLGVDCEILEDDTPQPMPELTVPDFDSFVAFDLETSGTYGAANGDAPASITEIGAVRVEKGEIVGRFSMLVNPDRKILPHISRMTGITDEMVANEPKIDAAMRSFADFVGSSILIGHNIKASDLYYINRAAQQTGVRIENPYFDTVCLARLLKKAQGWESVKLEYLAEQLGVKQTDAHRACCDAEATASIYFKLRELQR